MATESNKKRPVSKHTKRRLAQAVKGVIEGKTQSEIAEEMGLCRQTVNRLLSTDEVETILRKAESKAVSLIEKSLAKVEEVIEAGDPTNALKASLAVLRSKGILKEQVDLNHNLPTPFVIQYEGTKVVMGAKLPHDDKGARKEEDGSDDN